MQKIDSETAFNAWASTAAKDRAINWFTDNTNFMCCRLLGENTPTIPWWMLREQIRTNSGTYQTTEVLGYVNKLFPICSHVSVLDNTKVAHTPDTFAGTKDKQLQTTIQKLLYKFCPFFTENHIQQLSADHFAELTPDVRMFNGWDLTDHYIQGFDGLGACMSDKIKYNRSTHPTLAYHTPHIHVACLYKNNKITARSLVYENGSDKRYFRVYGNNTLKKYLESNGYKSGNWHGVAFNTVKATYGYIFPYLDAFNGRGANQDCSIALIDNVIYGVSNKKEIKEALNYNIYSALSTQGVAKLTNVSGSQLVITDAITGVIYNVLDAPGMQSVWVNKAKVLTAHVPNYFTYLYVNGLYGLYVHPDDCIIVNERNCVKDDFDLSKLLQLDSTLYPDSQDKYYSQGVCTTVSGKVIRNVDAVEVLNKERVSFYYHKSEFKPRDFVRVKDGMYVTKDTPYVVTTSKTKVVKGIHTFYTLVTGEHVIRRPKYWLSVFGEEFYFSSAEEKKTWITNNKAALIEKEITSKPLNLYVWRRSIEQLTDVYGYMYNSYSSSSSLDALKKAKALMTEPKTVSVLNTAIAELEAVEAPHYLYPLKETNEQ